MKVSGWPTQDDCNCTGQVSVVSLWKCVNVNLDVVLPGTDDLHWENGDIC